jgi:molybdopterin converting factor small subunit
MEIEVRLFARARDLADQEHIQVQLTADAHTVADLKAAIAEQFPALSPLVPHLHVALGTDYADDTTTLDSSQSVSCFPPVSGG